LEHLYVKLLGEEDVSSSSCHTMASVFESGDARISELVVKWLTALGTNAGNLVSSLDDVSSPGGVSLLVSECGATFPGSMRVSVLLMHLAWEQCQAWARDRDSSQELETIVRGCWGIQETKVRLQFMALVWKTFFQRPLIDAGRITESLGSSVGSRATQCREQLQMNADSVGDWLRVVGSFLDCFLQTLSLCPVPGQEEELPLSYDVLDVGGSSTGLLTAVLSCSTPSSETLSLEQQLAWVLGLAWQLKVDTRPLTLFNTSETQQLFNTGPGIIHSLFTDQNVTVVRSRSVWLERVLEAAVGHIHRIPGCQGGDYDTEHFEALVMRCRELGRLWFLSDHVRLAQVEALFRAGFDSLAWELLSSVTDKELLVGRLLELCLLRLTRQVYSQEEEGGVATLQVSLVSQLSARRDSSLCVSDASIADTVSLLAWVTSHTEEQEKHELATAALGAARVLQVRSNRAATR